MRRIFSIAAVALMGVVGLVVPANAATPNCAKGYYCVWSDFDYSGSGFLGSSGDVNNYAVTYPGMENRGSSVFNNGNYNAIRAYVNADKSGWYFDLRNPKYVGINRDPDLRNGAGYGPYNSENFNDKLSRHTWFSL